MITSTQQSKGCQVLPNTNGSKEMYNKISEIVKDKAGVTIDFECSEKNDEIKGTCS